ncbi:hypothetical protein [Gordonia aichiensis]
MTEDATVVETTTGEGGANATPAPVPNGTPAPVTDSESESEPDTPDEPDLSGDGTENDEPDTFPRSYVEQLRQENGRYRQRAQRADDLAHRLHTALVEQTGKLADASDLPFDEKHLDDADSLTAAIDALISVKPHLAARRIAGDIGQGASKPSDGVNLLNILRGN